MALTSVVAAVTSVVMALTPVLGFGTDWEKAYTSPAAACRVAASEIANNGGPSFDCNSGSYTMPTDEKDRVVASLASGTRSELNISYDKVTKKFKANYAETNSPQAIHSGAGFIPVCIDSGHVTKKGNARYFDSSGSFSDISLEWDRCYQGQTAGIEFFTAVFDNADGGNVDPSVHFHGSPYRYFSVLSEDGSPTYGISWVDWIGEWTLEYDDTSTYTVSVAFLKSGLRYNDWPQWWQDNILEYCKFGLIGANPTTLAYGRGYVLPSLDSSWSAMYDNPCYKGRLDAFQAEYLNDWSVVRYDTLPRLRFSVNKGYRQEYFEVGLFEIAWNGNNNASQFPDIDRALDDEICSYETDNAGGHWLERCSDSRTAPDRIGYSRAFLQYYNFTPGNPTDVNNCLTAMDPVQSPQNCQLGYARLGTAGGTPLAQKLELAVLVPKAGNDVGSGEPPLTGFDPDPTNPDPNTQTYIYYDYSTGDTINTGVCVHSSCVWNTWITNAPVYEAPTYQGPAWICEDTILCLDNWNAWWQSSMNYTNALSKSWMDFIHGEAVWIVGILYPQNAPFDPFTMLLALIENNAATVSLRNVQDGVLSSFETFFRGQRV